MTSRTERWERAVDAPLTVSTIAFLGAYAWPILQPDLGSSWKSACSVAVWATWAMLAADLVVRLSLAPDRKGFARQNAFDLIIVVLPLLRPLRLLRLVTLLTSMTRHAGSSLRSRVGIYLAGSVVLVVFVGSLAVLSAERGKSGPIQSFGDALWWSFTTITTVGYGDTFPVTTTGRLIGAALMLAGIAILGTVAALFASWLVERVSEEGAKTGAATRADIHALSLEVRTLREELLTRDPPANSSFGPTIERGIHD